MLVPTLLWLEGFPPLEDVIGYDFFNNFTLVVDCLGGKVSIAKNRKEN